MTRDRSSTFAALADLALVVATVALVAVSAKAAKGPEQNALYLITLDYPLVDVDLDLWLVTPQRKPVFYVSREAECATLDRDARGFLDGVVPLEGGGTVKVSSFKETVTLRCSEPGRYDIGVNFFANHVAAGSPNGPIKARVEIVKLNPAVATVFAKDVELSVPGQTVNTVSFDLNAAGDLTLQPPPLEPVTAAYFKPRTP